MDFTETELRMIADALRYHGTAMTALGETAALTPDYDTIVNLGLQRRELAERIRKHVALNAIRAR